MLLLILQLHIANAAVSALIQRYWELAQLNRVVVLEKQYFQKKLYIMRL